MPVNASMQARHKVSGNVKVEVVFACYLDNEMQI